MDDLIKALQILRKYGNPRNPTHCEHDVLTIAEINADDVTLDDIAELEQLGFHCFEEYGERYFHSYRFGSA
jgi:hypothetical protein